MEKDKSVAYSSVSLWKPYDSISIAAARVTEARQVLRNIHFRIYYVIHLYMDYWMTFLGDVMPASGYEVVWIMHSIFAFPPLYYCGRPLVWWCFTCFFVVVCAMWFFTWLFKLQWSFRKHKQIYRPYPRTLLYILPGLILHIIGFLQDKSASQGDWPNKVLGVSSWNLLERRLFLSILLIAFKSDLEENILLYACIWFSINQPTYGAYQLGSQQEMSCLDRIGRKIGKALKQSLIQIV